MILLGIDLGTSSIKASLLDGESGQSLGSAFYPEKEMALHAPKPGWAEQDPETWWSAAAEAVQRCLRQSGVQPEAIGAIGISYQMHGLVAVDADGRVLRPSIIWCDSRAVELGDRAFAAIGEEKALAHLLNSPGNFTASKLAWVKEQEPDLYARIHRIMLPGDYLAYKLTGEMTTTLSGLSEGILWDFKEKSVAQLVLDAYGLEASLLPPLVPTFGEQGRLTAAAAGVMGLKAGTPVTYRAGDQPNNALSLQVLEPGEIAATAGTSGVVYGVSDVVRYDPQSRVNTFAHVNHGEQTRLGVLLCVNGTGILNSWLKHQLSGGRDYPEMNEAAAKVPVGAEGVTVVPFGNGAERVLGNQEIGCQIGGLDFNRHRDEHLLRAAQEGIVFALHYGMGIMARMGIQPQVIRAGHANMFLSPLFGETLANLAGVPIELYNTDGAQGAARGAGIGVGHFAQASEAFAGLSRQAIIEPDPGVVDAYQVAYERWEAALHRFLS